MSLKDVAKAVTPAPAWRRLRLLLNGPDDPLSVRRAVPSAEARVQDLDIYWTDQAIRSMETWGTGTAWDEIQCLLAALEGKTLDIACGTGKVMEILARFPALDIHGIDISDVLIQKARDRGLPASRVQVCDATKLPFADGEFDYSYSIGSLEHFTEHGIEQFVQEAHRVTRRASFHQMPTSRSGRDEGWLTTMQTFHNNSVDWWLRWFTPVFREVLVLDSRWEDRLSVGKWFVLKK